MVDVKKEYGVELAIPRLYWFLLLEISLVLKKYKGREDLGFIKLWVGAIPYELWIERIPNYFRRIITII